MPRALKLLALAAAVKATLGFSFRPHAIAVLSRTTRLATFASDGDKASLPSSGLENMTAAEIDALPTIDELVASGAAQRVVFQGGELSERFHWKTRALAGEFSRDLAPEADTEAGGEGSIEAALLTYPASVTLTVVGKLLANAAFVGDVTAAVRALTGEEVVVEAKERSRGDVYTNCSGLIVSTLCVHAAHSLRAAAFPRPAGKFVSLQIQFTAVGPGTSRAVRTAAGAVEGAMMVF